MAGFLRGWLEWAIGELADIGVIEEAAETGYGTALDMCANEGQVSVIDMTGYDAFESAASAAAEGGDGLNVLMSACPYPEAVGIILEECYGIMEEIINEGIEGLLLDEGDGEGEEFEEEMDSGGDGSDW